MISAFSARSDGCGYLRTSRSVPSTFPGSTSSFSAADWMAVVLVLLVVEGAMERDLVMVRSAEAEGENAWDLLTEQRKPTRDMVLRFFIEDKSRLRKSGNTSSTINRN